MQLHTQIQNGTPPLHLCGAVLCAALLAAGWLFGVQPLLAQSSEDTSVVEQAAQAQQNADRAKAELDRLRAGLEAMKSELDHQPVSLQSAQQLNPLLAQLARWAEANGLSITQTRAGRPVALMYYDYVPITFAGEGRYTDLLALLRKLREGRGDLGVVWFTAKRVMTKGGPGVDFTLELAWYVMAEDDPGGRDPTHDRGDRGGPATAAVRIGR